MRLKAIHCYQYVRFQNSNINFVSADVKGMEDTEITLLDKGVVEIKSAKDHIIVWPTNIAYGIPMNEVTKVKKVENRGALKNNDPSTPKKAF